MNKWDDSDRLKEVNWSFWRKVWVLLLILCLVGVSGLWIGAGSIAKPDRRKIQEYHKSYLDHPENHGLVIEKLDLDEGKIPFLVVRPDRDRGVAKRGGILRKQLLEGGLILPEFGEERGLLVLLHGRNGRKEDLLPVAERFCAVGFICAIPDLPGHGESELETVGFGAREFERQLPGRVADEVRENLGLERMPEYLWSLSMGGSFAVHACWENPNRWKRMVIVASFDRLEGVVRDSLGAAGGALMAPVKTMTTWRGGPEIGEVNPALLASKIFQPTLVVHGDADDLISLERGKALYESFAGKKEFLLVPGGTHDNVLVTDAPVFAGMARWFLEK